MNDALVECVSEKINSVLSECHGTLVCCLGENNAARIKSDKKHTQSFVRENFADLATFNGNLDFIFPEGTRFFCELPHLESVLLIIEQEPMVRTLRFSTGFFKYDRSTFEYHHRASYRDKDYPYLERFNVQLAFPYVISLIEITSRDGVRHHAYFLNKPLSFMDDELYAFHLPNIYAGHRVCTGFRSFPSGLDTLDKKVVYLINHFWGSLFNTDSYETYEEMQKKDKRFANIWEWEKNSLANPSFVLDVDREPLRSLDQAISLFTKGASDYPSIFNRCLSNFAIQCSEHTGNLIDESCSSVKTQDLNLSKANVKDIADNINEEKKRIASLKGLVRGLRVRIRKDSRYYYQAPDIPGVVSSDFDRYCRADQEYHWAYVVFDNGLRDNLYRRDDLEVFKE